MTLAGTTGIGRPLLLALLALLASLAAQSSPPGPPPAAAGQPPRVLRVELAGVVNPGTSSYLRRALAHAQAERLEALLVRLDTPGGMLDSTREIVKDFLGARVPVIVYVSPAGARAGSAGMFITLAAHVAAMAPGTNIGAAHPVALGGRDMGEGQEQLSKKVVNDAAALARAIAEQRGRDAQWAERAVRESASATAAEALEAGVIDLVAESQAALLEKAHGREVKTASGEMVVLRLEGAELHGFSRTFQERALITLGDPNLAYLLMMLGLLGLMIELFNPGLIIPGGLGLLLLLLAGIGLNLLPVNVGGVLLLAIAAALFVAEFFVTSFGLLTLGAIACLVLGSLLLMDFTHEDFYVDPTVEVSWGLVVPTVALMSALALAMMLLIYRTHRRRGTTGAEGLRGETGLARTAVGPQGGKVLIHGELWQAWSEFALPAGARVRVVDLEGLKLKVAALPPEGPGPGD